MNNQNNRDFADFCNFFRNAESEDNGKCPGADCDDETLNFIYQSLKALEFEGYSLCNDEDVAEFCDYFYITTKKDFMQSLSVDLNGLNEVISAMEERTTIFYDDQKKFFMYPSNFDFDTIEQG